MQDVSIDFYHRISQNYCVLSKAKPEDVLNCLAMPACVHAMREYMFLDPIVGLILVVFSGRGCVD